MFEKWTPLQSSRRIEAVFKLQTHTYEYVDLTSEAKGWSVFQPCATLPQVIRGVKVDVSMEASFGMNKRDKAHF